MNVQLKDITVTARDGRVAHLEQVYIRGSHVRYFVVPDMLRYNRYLQRLERRADYM
jgi:small nuclear ribonucleoprotein D3